MPVVYLKIIVATPIILLLIVLFIILKTYRKIPKDKALYTCTLEIYDKI